MLASAYHGDSVIPASTGDEVHIAENVARPERGTFSSSCLSDRTRDYIFTPLHDIPAGYPALDFKPILLRSWFLATLCVLCLCGAAGTMAIDRRAARVNRNFYTSNHYIRLSWEYCPMLAASVTGIVWGATVGALGRMTPFFSMARRSSRASASGERTLGASYFPMNNVTTAVKNRHFLLFSIAFLRLIAVLLLPSLKSSFIVASQGDLGVWTFHVSHKVALALVALYSTLAVMAASILIRLHHRSTGLKWDPSSIVDQIALFHGSNVLADFDILESLRRNQRLRALHDGTYRIGYWRVKCPVGRRSVFACHGPAGGEESYIWYGIARDSSLEAPLSTIANYTSSHRLAILANPYRAFDPQLRPIALFIWLCVILVSLTLVGFVAIRGVVPKAMHLNISSSLATFLFRSLFTSFIAFVGSAIFRADIVYRATQPFAGMHAIPQPASENIFLKYSCDLPGLVTWNALLNGHYKVAYFSVLSLGLSAVPALSGTLFMISGDQHTSTVATTLPKAAAMLAVLLVWLISLPIIWPSPKRTLPHNIYNIADLLTFCHASYLVQQPAICVQRPNDTQHHLESKVFLAEHLYLFGRYIGTDGREHVGFDIVYDTEGSRTQHVFPIKPPRLFSTAGLHLTRVIKDANVDDGDDVLAP